MEQHKSLQLGYSHRVFQVAGPKINFNGQVDAYPCLSTVLKSSKPVVCGLRILLSLA